MRFPIINSNLGPILPRFRDIAGFRRRATPPDLIRTSDLIFFNFGALTNFLHYITLRVTKHYCLEINDSYCEHVTIVISRLRDPISQRKFFMLPDNLNEYLTRCGDNLIHCAKNLAIL